MVKLSVIFIFLILFTIIPLTESAGDFSYNRLFNNIQSINVTNIFQNITINGTTINHSNSTDYWITTIGILGTVNTTQFNNIAETLTIDEDWGNALWCELTGCTMAGNINMGGNNITNADTITADFFVGDGSGLTGISASGDSNNNSFHIYINGSAYNNVVYNITKGDADDVEFTIIPGRKFIFGDTFT